jgi:hypothetical protein
MVVHQADTMVISVPPCRPPINWLLGPSWLQSNSHPVVLLTRNIGRYMRSKSLLDMVSELKRAQVLVIQSADHVTRFLHWVYPFFLTETMTYQTSLQWRSVKNDLKDLRFSIPSIVTEGPNFMIAAQDQWTNIQRKYAMYTEKVSELFIVEPFIQLINFIRRCHFWRTDTLSTFRYPQTQLPIIDLAS